MRSMTDKNLRLSIKMFLKSIIPDIKVFLGEDDISQSKWVKVRFGDSGSGLLSDTSISLYCCTKGDKEGLRLAEIIDSLREHIVEGRYIPYLEPIVEEPYWKKKIDMLITSINMSNDLIGDNDVKIKIIDISIIAINE